MVIRQVSSFAAIGLVATLLHYLIMTLLVTGSGVHPLPASAVGFSISALVNYWLNYHWTFSSRRSHWSTLPRFVVVAACGLCLNSLIVWLGLDGMGLHWIAAQGLATVSVLVWNFTVNRYWTFASGQRPPISGGRS